MFFARQSTLCFDGYAAAYFRASRSKLLAASRPCGPPFLSPVKLLRNSPGTVSAERLQRCPQHLVSPAGLPFRRPCPRLWRREGTRRHISALCAPNCSPLVVPPSTPFFFARQSALRFAGYGGCGALSALSSRDSRRFAPSSGNSAGFQKAGLSRQKTVVFLTF